jgi:hypothetical protein
MTTIQLDPRSVTTSPPPSLASIVESGESSVARQFEEFTLRPELGFPASQAYFWTEAWQRGERESAAARREGRVRHFANGDEAVAWLLSPDD